MRRILKALGRLSLALATLSLLLTVSSWPPGGLFFALPYIFLFSAAGFGGVGGVLLLLTRAPRDKSAAGRSEPPSHPA